VSARTLDVTPEKHSALVTWLVGVDEALRPDEKHSIRGRATVERPTIPFAFLFGISCVRRNNAERQSLFGYREQLDSIGTFAKERIASIQRTSREFTISENIFYDSIILQQFGGQQPQQQRNERDRRKDTGRYAKRPPSVTCL
jgi:hypothetical protein